MRHTFAVTLLLSIFVFVVISFFSLKKEGLQKKNAPQNLVISKNFLQAKFTSSEWSINLVPMLPQEDIKTFLKRNTHLVILKNGYPFKQLKLTTISDLDISLPKVPEQVDYSFFIYNGNKIFTAYAPILIGEFSPKSKHKVKYSEDANLSNNLEGYTKSIREKLLNNLVYVVKKPKMKGIREVSLTRTTKNNYKVQIVFEDKSIGNVPLENDYVWIKVDEGYNKNLHYSNIKYYI